MTRLAELLAGVLAGRVAPGVYHWRPALTLEQLADAATPTGWRTAYLDGEGVQSRGEAYDALKVTLGLPAHVASDLDALWEGLRDLPRPTVVLWEEWGSLAWADRPAFVAIARLLDERAAEVGGLVVLLRGEGPATDYPSLDGSSG
ncbi:MAG TPA: barstar family protein [Nocardioides sp.]|uniref:barstar family protein n=1 Tax=Nocardioides sp. TaxID=35761 RepID=UPI002EDB73A8